MDIDPYDSGLDDGDMDVHNPTQMDIPSDVDDHGAVPYSFDTDDDQGGDLPHYDGFSEADGPANFDPDEPHSSIIGDPASDMDDWHMQTHPDTCAVVSQEFILDELTGEDYSEEQLREEAMANGWYTPGGGTPLDAMGNILENHGIEADREYGASLDDLAQALANGDKVLVAVHAEDIWYPDASDDTPLHEYPGMPGQEANHAVEPIGLNYDDPEHPMVILNDPGTPNGRGSEVPVDDFMAAWSSSGNYMVVAHAPGGVGDFHLGGEMLGGYYNADGTYHWTSDNTDRDANTGAVVRRW